MVGLTKSRLYSNSIYNYRSQEVDGRSSTVFTGVNFDYFSLISD